MRSSERRTKAPGALGVAVFMFLLVLVWAKSSPFVIYKRTMPCLRSFSLSLCLDVFETIQVQGKKSICFRRFDSESDTVVWEEAAKKCAAIGADLVHFESSEEFEELKALDPFPPYVPGKIKNTQHEKTGAFWLSIYSEYGQLHRLEGGAVTAVSFDMFYNLTQADLQKKKCAVAFIEEGKNWTLTDCNATVGYYCRAKVVSEMIDPPEVSVVGNTPTGNLTAGDKILLSCKGYTGYDELAFYLKTSKNTTRISLQDERVHKQEDETFKFAQMCLARTRLLLNLTLSVADNGTSVMCGIGPPLVPACGLVNSKLCVTAATLVVASPPNTDSGWFSFENVVLFLLGLLLGALVSAVTVLFRRKPGMAKTPAAKVVEDEEVLSGGAGSDAGSRRSDHTRKSGKSDKSAKSPPASAVGAGSNKEASEISSAKPPKP